MTTGYVSEIFSSIQGEGLFVGERQLFIRLAGCNLQCFYCDTPLLEISSPGKLETDLAQKNFSSFNNPVKPEEVVKFILPLLKNKFLHHSLVITGGEPLLQTGFLLELLPLLKEQSLRIYLETNGTLPKNLKEIVDFIDIISLDFKLSETARLPRSYQKEHLECLKIALFKEVFAKIVFTRETRITEIEPICQAIASIDPQIPLILQPVTPTSKVKNRPTPQDCLSLQAVAKRHLENVRVIPQINKILGLA